MPDAFFNTHKVSSDAKPGLKKNKKPEGSHGEGKRQDGGGAVGEMSLGNRTGLCVAENG